MKQIYLVRHAESQALGKDSDEYLNPGLSDLGLQQAPRLAGRLKDIEVDGILISPLRRAWQTYQLAHVNAPRVEFDSRLVELVPGYEKILPVPTCGGVEPDRHDVWLKGGEERCADLLGELLAGEENSFLLFGHGLLFSYFFRAFAGIGSAEYYIHTDNTGVSLIELEDEGRRVVQYWNDRAHVADLLE